MFFAFTLPSSIIGMKVLFEQTCDNTAFNLMN
jgi:putative effector of murein hydrolase LrgA (UPF0299 family)